MRVLLVAFATLAVLTATAAADDPVAQFRLGEGGRPHVGVPFTLELAIDGFDETPPPEVPKLVIPDATVTSLGATPNVSRSIQIVNGRRTDSTHVTWSLRWRVEVTKAEQMRVPATTVTQGSKRATAPSGTVPVETVPNTDTMKISLELPNRAVFVGETVPVTMTWLFQNQPQDQTFAVPLLSSDAFTVSAPAVTNQRRALTLSAGAKDLQLPYTIDQTTVNGTAFNRLTVQLFVAPRLIPPGGKLEVAPATVVASLPVGRADFFGNAPTQMFRASDVPRTLVVKALPETDRPPTFSGAVGDQFSIAVKTSRSVVQLGEPVELAVTIKSNQPLDTLSLGKLDGDGRLPKDAFTVPADPPTGELTDEGKTKTFKVTAQVTGPATEVPALAFSYFDPTKEQYRTIKSEPIALSVKGGSTVGAGDVVSAAPTKRTPTTSSQVTDDSALVNAELALSSAGAADERPLGGTVLWVLIGLLYAIPLALLGARTWQLRTRGQREEAAEVRAARHRVEVLLDKGTSAPAREIAGPLGSALRDLARVLGREVDDHGLIGKLETEAFSPESAGKPLSPDVRSDAAGLLRRWLGEARKAPPRRVATAVIVLAALFGLRATSAHAASFDDGRAAYQEAMEMTTNATARKAAFSRAEIALGEAARATPDRPELLADWGNAALGAGDVATATLAYRRALQLDAGNARARHNLAWLRSRQAEAFRPASGGATDTLLFFHTWPRARKLIVGAAAFAIAILLLVPWAGRRRRGVTGLAVIPFAVWLAMIGSVILEDRHEDDGVVMDDVVMRAADSAGAPAALSQPLPRGTEVTLLERRDAWTRIRVANGTSGWVPGGAVERIAP